MLLHCLVGFFYQFRGNEQGQRLVVAVADASSGYRGLLVPEMVVNSAKTALQDTRIGPIAYFLFFFFPIDDIDITTPQDRTKTWQESCKVFPLNV